MNKSFVKSIFAAFVISVSIFLSSCATTVNFRVSRPAQLDINGAGTIAVLPFKPYGYTQSHSNESLGMQILINTFYQVFDIQDPQEKNVINNLRNQIITSLVDSPYIQLVSSDSVELALKSGAKNPADVYITGEVIYFDVNDEKHDKRKLVKESVNGKPAVYEIIRTWTREVTFNFRYSIVSSDNKVLYVYTFEKSKKTASDYSSKSSLPSAYSLLEDDIKNIARTIMRQIQPYSVSKSITLLELKTKDKDLKARMKAADKLASNRFFNDAFEAYTQIYNDTYIVEAGYNAAIMQEALGNLSEAEKLMKEIYDRYPETRVLRALSDIRNEIDMANRLKKQIEKPSSNNDSEDDS